MGYIGVVQGKAVLRGTARIGQKALFLTQGPQAAYPHSNRCQVHKWLHPGTATLFQLGFKLLQKMYQQFKV